MEAKMNIETLYYAVEYERYLSKNKMLTSLTTNERLHFPTRSSAEKWIIDVKCLNKNMTLTRFRIKELVKNV